MPNSVVPTWRDEVEKLADELEVIARIKLDRNNPVDNAIRTDLFAKAWDLKQYARAGSSSEGV